MIIENISTEKITSQNSKGDQNIQRPGHLLEQQQQQQRLLTLKSVHCYLKISIYM